MSDECFWWNEWKIKDCINVEMKTMKTKLLLIIGSRDYNGDIRQFNGLQIWLQKCDEELKLYH